MFLEDAHKAWLCLPASWSTSTRHIPVSTSLVYVKVRRFPPERKAERIREAIMLASAYSRDPVIKWLSRDEAVVDLSKLILPRVRVRWADGELIAEIERE